MKYAPSSRTWEEIANDPSMTEGVRRYYRGLIEGEQYRKERARLSQPTESQARSSPANDGNVTAP